VAAFQGAPVGPREHEPADDDNRGEGKAEHRSRNAIGYQFSIREGGIGTIGTGNAPPCRDEEAERMPFGVVDHFNRSLPRCFVELVRWVAAASADKVRKHAKNFANALTLEGCPALRWDGVRGERIRSRIFPRRRNKIAARDFIN
jgi:hypothetical protein